MAKEQSPKIITKKHKARLEREQIQRKRILIVASIIAALIIIVLIYGVLDQTILKDQKPVAKVGDQVIRSDEFIKQVKFQRYQLNQQALQYQSLKQIFGTDSENSSYIDSLINQIQTQMGNTESLGSSVLDNMINDIIITNYAKLNSLTVSDSEVDKAFQENFSYYPDGTPTPENTISPIATSTLNPTQYAIITATPTIEPSPTVQEPTPTEELIDVTPVATSTSLPTATPYTLEGYETQFQAMVDSYSGIDFSKADLLKLMKNQLLGTKVYEAITKDVPKEEEQVWARHILVATIEEALAVKQRLDNGEDFAAIAAELSTDTSNNTKGGDLGWFGRGKMVTEFEDAAFAMNIGEISNPIQTSSGFHVIQLIGKEVRPLSSTDLDSKKAAAFSEWLSSEKEKVKIEKFDSVWKAVVPSEPIFGQ